ncbi:MAG TPA: hypothetical protein VF767_12605 [Bryobacteraceae bacterium]
MAKIKAAARKRKKGAKSAWNAVPCAILVLGLMTLVGLLFFYSLKG